MSVHGRHEMPGWRGYLPESIDRASRRGPGQRGGVLRPVPRRVVAVGALAVCAVAGGAAIHARSVGPATSPGSADGTSLLQARTSAWTTVATPVLASVETELRRTDEVRHRWDASAVARRDGSAPGAVVALLERRAELAHHRDGLRSALTAIRSAPGAEAALAAAWPKLTAAQDMLRSLDATRGALGDPLEAAVLRLALGEPVPGAPGPGSPSGRDARTSSPPGVADAGTVALAAATAPLAEREAAVAATAEIPAVTSPAEPEQPAPTAATSDAAAVADAPEGATSSTPEPAVVAAPRASETDDSEPDQPTEDSQVPQNSSSLEPVLAVPEPTMLTFERASSATTDAAAPDPEAADAEAPDAATADSEASGGTASSPETGDSGRAEGL